MKNRAISLTLSLAVLLCAGESCHAGIFTRRSGEIFQTTREGPGPVTCHLLMFGVLCPPLGLVLFPLAAVAALVDECVISPVVDLVCLPYDLSCERHGHYLRVVDEEGKPLQGARITALSYFGSIAASTQLSELTDEDGLVYVSRISDDHYLKRMRVSKEGYCDFVDDSAYRPSRAPADERGRIVRTMTLRKAVRADRGADVRE